MLSSSVSVAIVQSVSQIIGMAEVGIKVDINERTAPATSKEKIITQTGNGVGWLIDSGRSTVLSSTSAIPLFYFC